MRNSAVNNKPYIPDSSKAEYWLSEDVFVYRDMKFKILPNGDVVHLRKNGRGKRGNAREHTGEL